MSKNNSHIDGGSIKPKDPAIPIPKPVKPINPNKYTCCFDDLDCPPRTIDYMIELGYCDRTKKCPYDQDDSNDDGTINWCVINNFSPCSETQPCQQEGYECRNIEGHHCCLPSDDGPVDERTEEPDVPGNWKIYQCHYPSDDDAVELPCNCRTFDCSTCPEFQLSTPLVPTSRSTPENNCNENDKDCNGDCFGTALLTDCYIDSDGDGFGDSNCIDYTGMGCEPIPIQVCTGGNTEYASGQCRKEENCGEDNQGIISAVTGNKIGETFVRLNRYDDTNPPYWPGSDLEGDHYQYVDWPWQSAVRDPYTISLYFKLNASIGQQAYLNLGQYKKLYFEYNGDESIKIRMSHLNATAPPMDTGMNPWDGDAAGEFLSAEEDITWDIPGINFDDIHYSKEWIHFVMMATPYLPDHSYPGMYWTVYLNGIKHTVCNNCNMDHIPMTLVDFEDLRFVLADASFSELAVWDYNTYDENTQSFTSEPKHLWTFGKHPKDTINDPIVGNDSSVTVDNILLDKALNGELPECVDDMNEPCYQSDMNPYVPGNPSEPVPAGIDGIFETRTQIGNNDSYRLYLDSHPQRIKYNAGEYNSTSIFPQKLINHQAYKLTFCASNTPLTGNNFRVSLKHTTSDPDIPIKWEGHAGDTDYSLNHENCTPMGLYFFNRADDLVNYDMEHYQTNHYTPENRYYIEANLLAAGSASVPLLISDIKLEHLPGKAYMHRTKLSNYDDVNDYNGSLYDVNNFEQCYSNNFIDDSDSIFCESNIFDDCGVCDGNGVAQECGCGAPGTKGLPEGYCNCDATLTLDCAGECGGPAVEDCLGICNGGMFIGCTGECDNSVHDECGICGGWGELPSCDCDGHIREGFCDCFGTTIESTCGSNIYNCIDTRKDGYESINYNASFQSSNGIYDCVCKNDDDEDGVCDEIDDCDGDLDICGVCNGPGIPDNYCNCNGDRWDCQGICGGKNRGCDCNDWTFWVYDEYVKAYTYNEIFGNLITPGYIDMGWAQPNVWTYYDNGYRIANGGTILSEGNLNHNEQCDPLNNPDICFEEESNWYYFWVAVPFNIQYELEDSFRLFRCNAGPFGDESTCFDGTAVELETTLNERNKHQVTLGGDISQGWHLLSINNSLWAHEDSSGGTVKSCDCCDELETPPTPPIVPKPPYGNTWFERCCDECCEDYQPPSIIGCTDRDACNFNPDAMVDNGTCWYAEEPCTCRDYPSGPDSARVDCYGVCNGENRIDDCGVCSCPFNLSPLPNQNCGGNPHPFNFDQDCSGECFGNDYSCHFPCEEEYCCTGDTESCLDQNYECNYVQNTCCPSADCDCVGDSVECDNYTSIQTYCEAQANFTTWCTNLGYINDCGGVNGQWCINGDCITDETYSNGCPNNTTSTFDSCISGADYWVWDPLNNNYYSACSGSTENQGNYSLSPCAACPADHYCFPNDYIDVDSCECNSDLLTCCSAAVGDSLTCAEVGCIPSDDCDACCELADVPGGPYYDAGGCLSSVCGENIGTPDDFIFMSAFYSTQGQYDDGGDYLWTDLDDWLMPEGVPRAQLYTKLNSVYSYIVNDVCTVDWCLDTWTDEIAPDTVFPDLVLGGGYNFATNPLAGRNFISFPFDSRFMNYLTNPTDECNLFTILENSYYDDTGNVLQTFCFPGGGGCSGSGDGIMALVQGGELFSSTYVNISNQCPNGTNPCWSGQDNFTTFPSGASIQLSVVKSGILRWTLPIGCEG